MTRAQANDLCVSTIPNKTVEVPADETQLRLRASNLTWREADGEVIILDTKSSIYASLNRSGRLLWELLAVGSTQRALVNALKSRYGLDTDRAEADVDAFVGALQDRGLLE
jgi:hypothetical protein